ncbi:MAG: cysteine hydrolase [Candidatus Thermoplasmatota archaeon]|nr:cysteine hydrolase [Candidatus Thermoplasmatota archaeon]
MNGDKIGETAILVIDMINDFVTGKLGCENAENIVPDLKRFLEDAEEKGIPRIFIQDNHEEDDPEISHWGQHAMKGEEGSETVPQLQGLADERLRKKFYDSFYRTDLEQVLEERDIEEMILTGVTTDICIQNTAAGAFYRGYDITVIEDGTAALSQEKHQRALDYMESIFGAEILKLEKIKERW